MKKAVKVLILFLICNMFFSEIVSFATIDFSGGLLDGKPFVYSETLYYEVTDNNLLTYVRVGILGKLIYEFDSPVSIIGYRMKVTVNNSIMLCMYDNNGNALLQGFSYGGYTGARVNKYDGEFVECNLNNVKKIIIFNVNTSSLINVYEFNVYPPEPEPIPPTQVKNVHIKNITSTSTLVAWNPNPQDENIIKYVVYVNGQKHGETIDTEYTITNLQPNTSYEVTVIAINEAGEGPPSEPCVFTTPEPEPEPPTPEPATQVKNVVIKGMTSTSATISWTPNPEAEKITKYVIYLNGEKYGETGDTEYVIDGLKEGEKYTVTVTAVNDLGEGPASESITFTTSKIADMSNSIKVQDILSAISVLFVNLWPLLAFALALIAITPITTALKYSFRRRSNA